METIHLNILFNYNTLIIFTMARSSNQEEFKKNLRIIIILFIALFFMVAFAIKLAIEIRDDRAIII